MSETDRAAMIYIARLIADGGCEFHLGLQVLVLALAETVIDLADRPQRRLEPPLRSQPK